jgi:hypothetical protein
MAGAKTTIDHGEIQRWVEARGGRPACMSETAGGSEPAILRIDFADPEEPLEVISWDEWFDAFEENKLAFIYEDEEGSRFNTLIDRASANGAG